MSHVVRIGQLTNELVQLITGYAPETDLKALKSCRDAAAKSLRSHRYGSTNQFNVQSSIEGLVEKCCVVGNDAVAEALHERFDELDLDAKWTPEILSLLLLLSDRPAEKASVEDLELLKSPTPPPSLTWEDILEDDPLDDPHIWEGVDYGADSSDDDTVANSHLEADETGPVSATTSPDATEALSPSALILSVEQDVKLDSFDKGDQGDASLPSSRKILDELRLIRDIVLMLRGLPTSTFTEQGLAEKLGPSTTYQLEHCSADAVHHALEEVSDVGSRIGYIREFVSTRRSVPLLQRFSALCEASVYEFEASLSAIEARYVSIQTPRVVSFLSIISEVQSSARTLIAVQAMLERLADSLHMSPHTVLDELHDICENQKLSGNDESSPAFVHMFASCLEVYWRPIKAWMEEGQVPKDSENFCILDNSTPGQPQDLWSERFSVRVVDGSPYAPAFLHEYLSDVLNTGKSVSFIREMGFAMPSSHEAAEGFSFERDLERTMSEASELIPFTVLLRGWLSVRLQDRHRPTWAPLRRHLFDDYGLIHVLDALETLFLSKDGSLFISFADSLSARLDTDDPSWNDQLIVENLARSIFGQSPVLDDRLITASVSSPPKSKLNPPSRSVHALSTIALSYSYPWPIATIVPRAALATYQDTLTLLLQLRRATLALAAARPHASAPAHQAPLALRHALLHALTTLHQHAAHALHAASQGLHAALRGAASMPALRAAHAAFEARVARAALRAPAMRTARDAVLGLCDVALLFAEEVGAEDAGAGAGVSLGRRRMNRVRGLRAQVGQLRDVLVGELRRGEDGEAGARRWAADDGREAWHALAEALDVGARRSRKAELL